MFLQEIPLRVAKCENGAPVIDAALVGVVGERVFPGPRLPAPDEAQQQGDEHPYGFSHSLRVKNPAAKITSPQHPHTPETRPLYEIAVLLYEMAIAPALKIP